IIIGKDWRDLEEYGEKGTIFIGRHIVGTGEDTHLTNQIKMDVSRPHIVLICGKRGTGKSYTAGVIAEEIERAEEDVKRNLSVIMIDTMGIYWSMKMPNEKEEELLREWNMKPAGLKARLFVPRGYAEDYRKAGISVDREFTIAIKELSAEDWNIIFNFSPLSEHGILVEKAIKRVKSYGKEYSIDDIINEVEREDSVDSKIKDGVISMFTAAKDWGVFDIHGTNIEELMVSGSISILDVSHYTHIPNGWSVRSMIVGLISRKIFRKRLVARKSEERELIGNIKGARIPMVWLIIDEAHQFLPNIEVTAASQPLLTLIKEGREPGISLVLITQRPNKLHPDALSQADIVISHRLTSKADLEALKNIMQIYMLEDIEEYISKLPRMKGAAIILDDNSERILTAQIRPRISWHAGGSPLAIEKSEIYGE
ncbi:MAG TPA: ATP-binding protein, partial [Candidatus Aenigmarchaeota archaeon]|nr:ATP-binding protein [Candidatus Aenigmarchaeota archaeon]